MLVHELLFESAHYNSDGQALALKSDTMSYGELASLTDAFAHALVRADLGPSDRVAIYLPKTFETVISFLVASLAVGVFDQVNPLLKPSQVAYILHDCNVRV